MFLNYANSTSNKDGQNMNKNTDLHINSCGTYRLYTKSELTTLREYGRNDYQLIYVAAGKGYFYFNEDVETVVNAGNMVFYRPTEFQKYSYYGKDAPEIYWIHFSGWDIEGLLKKYGIDFRENFIFSGVNSDYAHLFKKIILELQLQKNFYIDTINMYFKEILIMLGRFIDNNSLVAESSSPLEIEKAVAYFYEHYNENINIEEYVNSTYISNSLFFRKFKLYTGMTPLQYILDIRLSNARKLLETTDYSIGEIALIIGYDNALYFSRLFHKHIGVSPKEYRKSVKNSTTENR